MRACLLAGLAALLCLPAPARAQLPSTARWHTIASDHFRVTYTEGLEPLARHAAAAAERARALLLDYVADAPAGTVDIVLSDNVDVSNGSATPFPGNRIYLYAKPPVDAIELAYVHDWIEFLVVHELAHTFHLDAVSGLGGALRRVFGRVPAAWPFFPGAGSPQWSIEGLAVVAESRFTGMGRVHGAYHRMVARAAALEDEIEDIDRLSSGSPVWPGAQRVYVYGSLFLHDLEARHGPEVITDIVRRTAGAIIPPSLWFDPIGRAALGVGFRTAYDDWRNRVTGEFRQQADSLRALGLTPTRALASHGGVAFHPRFSPDGSHIAYIASDRRSTPELRVIDARTGNVQWGRRLNGDASPAWRSDRELIVPQLQLVGPEHIYYELYRMSATLEERLTPAARLQDVSVARDGRIVAVQNVDGSNRLVRLVPDGALLTALTDAGPRAHWAGPRWSPDGRLIAVARWSFGGRHDILVLDPDGTVLETIGGEGVNSSPAWSPDGRFIVFASDRDGIPNLYAYDRERRGTVRVTRTLTGAFYPDVAPDGRTIAFSAYHHDGYHLEAMSVDFAELARAALLTSVAPAAPDMPVLNAPGDTTTGAAAPYRPLRSLAPRYWVPVLYPTSSGDFWGVGSSGRDLVGRHAWSAAVALGSDGRTAGAAAYSYRGLPEFGRWKPALTAGADRQWDRILEPERAGAPSIDEREDRGTAGISLTRPGWRSTLNAGLTGELVRRRRLLNDAPGFRLRDPDDRLIGARLLLGLNTARLYPFSISAEDGITTSVAVRQRWDRNPLSFTDSTGATTHYDGGYREATSWTALYRSLGRVRYANAVLALRATTLLRDGPGASTHGVGGSSGQRLDFGLLDAGSSEFLPVRGFPSGARRGTRAWSTSAEVRVPLALITHMPRPLPIFLDRLSTSAFFDAGDAECAAEQICDPARLGPPLLSTGVEAALDAALLGSRLRLRLGFALPLQGKPTGNPVYFQLGSSF